MTSRPFSPTRMVFDRAARTIGVQIDSLADRLNQDQSSGWMVIQHWIPFARPTAGKEGRAAQSPAEEYSLDIRPAS